MLRIAWNSQWKWKYLSDNTREYSIFWGTNCKRIKYQTQRICALSGHVFAIALDGIIMKADFISPKHCAYNNGFLKNFTAWCLWWSKTSKLLLIIQEGWVSWESDLKGLWVWTWLRGSQKTDCGFPLPSRSPLSHKAVTLDQHICGCFCSSRSHEVNKCTCFSLLRDMGFQERGWRVCL